MITNKTFYLKVKDHSVSQEYFDLYYEEGLDMLQTFPQPSLENLEKYYQNVNYISHTDSKRNMFEKMYHFVKHRTLQKKLQLVNSLQPQKGNLLDIGAGTGDFLAVCKRNAWRIFGVEPAENARTIAETKGILLEKETANFPNHYFDVITMWHVLEHVPNYEEQIIELNRILKPNGTLIVAVPNFKSFDANYYGAFWAAYDVPIHFWHFSKKAIQLIFEKHNFHLYKTLPMKFDSFYVSLLSEKYKTGKMNYIKAFYIGLLSNIKAFWTKEFSSHIYLISKLKNL